VDIGIPSRKAGLMATDEDIYSRIKSLVDEEHSLTGSSDAADRRRQLEEQLDQCWDLLRQRQARREFGQDAASAHSRPADEVENYLQ
jgi:DNA-binding transcriptional regulator PaaX